jgi:hypothetical protein
MHPDRILLGVLGCLALQQLFGKVIAKRQCAYCGDVNGHRQDCPFDLDQR